MHTHQRNLLETGPLEFARNPPVGVLRRAAHKKVSHQRHSAAKPPEGVSRGSCWPLCTAGCSVLEESGAEQLWILQKACAVEVVHALGTGPHSSSWLIWSTKTKKQNLFLLQCRRPGFHPRVGKIPWRRHGNPLQYSCLENSMDRGDWWAIVRRFTQSLTQLK